MKKLYILIFSFFTLVTLSGCSDLLNTESDLVEFEDDNTLDNPTDSVYSLMGIYYRMQQIADRQILLGEARGDLVTPTESASADLKRLAAFDFSGTNKYNAVSDYYAVINNCNYYLAHVDTALQRRGRLLFREEYAAVKTYRAWTYLQLVKAYGRVPLVLTPIVTEQQATEAMNLSYKSIQEICDYFIADLTPYAQLESPTFTNGSVLYFPTRLVLGDLCLWAGRYQEAATWYHDYLNDKKEPVTPALGRIYWYDPADYTALMDGYSGMAIDRYTISGIQMESRQFDGVVSDLPNVFNSTRENNYFFQLTPSEGMLKLSKDQTFCMLYRSSDTAPADTIYAPRTGLRSNIAVGDLRLFANYSYSSSGTQSEYSDYSSTIQSISKVSYYSLCIPTYRVPLIYLHYAEALNRCGLPTSAMAVLKYGLCRDNLKYVDSLEQVRAGQLIQFDNNVFTQNTVLGVHSLGSGNANADSLYAIRLTNPSPTRQDSIDYVENLIVNELALEGAFEGNRFYDLMRVALRRNDPAYLADPVSKRNGSVDGALRSRLMDTQNWYLPLP